MQPTLFYIVLNIVGTCWFQRICLRDIMGMSAEQSETIRSPRLFSEKEPISNIIGPKSVRIEFCPVRQTVGELCCKSRVAGISIVTTDRPTSARVLLFRYIREERNKVVESSREERKKDEPRRRRWKTDRDREKEKAERSG
jgi:hypothetical protein